MAGGAELCRPCTVSASMACTCGASHFFRRHDHEGVRRSTCLIGLGRVEELPCLWARAWRQRAHGASAALLDATPLSTPAILSPRPRRVGHRLAAGSQGCFSARPTPSPTPLLLHAAKRLGLRGRSSMRMPHTQAETTQVGSSWEKKAGRALEPGRDSNRGGAPGPLAPLPLLGCLCLCFAPCVAPFRLSRLPFPSPLTLRILCVRPLAL